MKSSGEDETIARYEIPGVGVVRLIESQDPKYHGNFYARVEDVGIPVRNCETENELRIRTGKYVFRTLEEKTGCLQKELDIIQESFKTMQLISIKRDLLNSFEIK